MPVIIVGADTPIGTMVTTAFASHRSEVRAFVSDPAAAVELRDLGVKVAVGDVSDGSHVGGAALGCFSAVLIAAAASDERERSFADGPADTVAGWDTAIAEAGVTRAIWVGDSPASPSTRESACLDPTERPIDEVVSEIVDLDDRRTL